MPKPKLKKKDFVTIDKNGRKIDSVIRERIEEKPKKKSTEKCKARLHLHMWMFGKEIEYAFYCGKEKDHNGAHQATGRGWTETHHLRNQVFSIYWFTDPNKYKEEV